MAGINHSPFSLANLQASQADNASAKPVPSPASRRTTHTLSQKEFDVALDFQMDWEEAGMQDEDDSSAQVQSVLTFIQPREEKREEPKQENTEKQPQTAHTVQAQILAPLRMDLSSNEIASDTFGSEHLIKNLIAAGEDDMFEILMPNGQKIDVVVNLQPTVANFMLSSESTALERELKRRRMELEQQLEQKMGKAVKLAVL